MPPPIPVVIVPYNHLWPMAADGYSNDLSRLNAIQLVHHVGSTSVPGLAAKPIIDLIPVVETLASIDAERPEVEALGYEWYGEYGIPSRRYCTLTGADGVRLAQIHIFQLGSPHIARHLAFRDYLRANLAIVRHYEREKLRAARLHPTDSHAYSDEKSDWVQRIEAEALAWHETHACRA